MTRGEQDQHLAAMGFNRVGRGGIYDSMGWNRIEDHKAWYIAPHEGGYLAVAREGLKATQVLTRQWFNDPIAAAAYLLIQAADQP